MGATSMLRGGVTRFLPREFPCERLNSTTSFVQQAPQTSLGDVEFEFLDDGGDLPFASASSDEFQLNQTLELDYDDDDYRVNGATVEENRSFWDNQHQVLQTNLFKTSSLESRIRNATKEAIRDVENAEIVCSCNRQIAASLCRNCLMIQVSMRLQKAGYNSAICKTKWRKSPTIPSGEHTFLDVIDGTSKKQDVRVMIEVNLRAEFEMARASEDYNGLVRRLPEVYVGKVERLSNIIKIMCMGAKKCMKENKMHMGPWRKHKYMQAKWLAPCERNTSTTSLSMGYSHQLMPKSKPKASLLTVDLLEKLPNNIHCTAVEVL
ncbi:hypothetical protein RJT34_04416 [Clitoria ternatea]|uniref:Uncharacterized protein n=1 Tax=Clitoria ternatea TaxID=43366 RepID=A0AAN9KNG6_CLITE